MTMADFGPGQPKREQPKDETAEVEQPKQVAERMSDEDQAENHDTAQEYTMLQEAQQAARFAEKIKKEGNDSHPPQRTFGEGGRTRKV
ncbi:uncharacterized protein FIESC28_00360 [Fusarium coffeatum]|uniref:Uncharacterized protein n=1 Tax=Fusarium coffeatum TaxID=231269 RepID=A0A366SBV5_9HYPO|nr:uncharacterized protein FIESC28_00360 [Fusarium coffeatum]RBR26779.1 hypothetical protein FIESC28_00360 [Fusarium coffeatum]